MIRAPLNKLLTTLDRSLFVKTVLCKCLKVDAKALTGLQSIKEFTLQIPKIKSIVSREPFKLILLDTSINASSINDLPSALIDFCIAHDAVLDHFELILDYDYWSASILH
jgi:hypothetical protein